MVHRATFIEAAARIIMAAAFLSSTLAPIPAFASSVPALQDPGTETPTETPTETSTPAVTPDTPTATASETPAPPSETPMPVETATPDSTETSTATSTATITPTAAPVTLILSALPEFLIPGGEVAIDWEIAGIAPDPSLTIQITLPAGVIPEEIGEASFDEKTGVLVIPVSVEKGQFKIQAGSAEAELLIEAVLLKGEESLAIAQLVIPAYEKFELDAAGGEVSAQDGRIKVLFGSEALTQDTVITIGAPSGDAVPMNSLSDLPFEIKAETKIDGVGLHEFEEQIEIEVDYSELNFPEASEENLFLFWYNPESNEWEALPTSVDQKTNTLRGITTHFTVFDVGVNQWDATRSPTVDGFQVANFTGAATYSMPIELPPGPGGLQPNVTLTYNSQVVDQATATTQGSWVGMGWALETGSILLDSGATGGTGDDTFLLSVGGASVRLAWDGSAFHAADENFWRFERNTGNDTWTVWDKTGNIYYFEATTKLTYAIPCNAVENVGGPAYLTYIWSLSRVRNVFGQELTYTYAEETKNVSMYTYVGFQDKCVNSSYPTETAVYPATILYPGGRYRVRFETETRTDYILALSTDSAHHSFERSRLKKIHVEQDADGNGSFETLIRRYDFSYAPNTDTTNIIFPSYSYSAGGKVNTLRSVQQYGVGATAWLPATTFTYGDNYGDNTHMTAAENGYGGRVEFTYDMWHYDPAPIKYHNIFYDFCVLSPWVTRGGGSTASISACKLVLNGTVINPGLTYGTNLPLLRPGGTYRLTANVSSLGSGVSVQLGVYDGIRDTLSDPFTTTGIQTYTFTLPSDAGSAQPLIVSTGGQANIEDFRVELLPSYYRVSQKRVFDGQGHQYDFTYTYQNPAINDQAHSSTCPPNTYTCDSIIETLTEFRGHDSVIETGPDGHKTEYSYFQNDSQKGQPSNVVVKTSGNTKLTETLYSWSVSALALPVPSGIEYMGFGHNWVRPASTEQRVYASNGVDYTHTRSASTYESTYGNLLTQADQNWTNGAWNTYRSTTFDYFPTVTSSLYLVGLPARQRAKNSGGIVVAETLNIYDSNSLYNSAPTAGKLTAVRTWVSGTQYSQVTYAYDAWGNATTITGYSGYGTASAAPGTGARTTYACYGGGGTIGGTACTDDGYHTYSLWNKNALGQITNLTYDYSRSVPLTESDPNDAGGNDTTISAEYDFFGRMKKLIRPGDSSGAPTLEIGYSASSSGLQVTLTQKINATQNYILLRKYDGMGRQYQTDAEGILTDFLYDGYGRVVSQSMPHTSSETVYYATTDYDALGRPLDITSPDSTSTTYGYNGLTSTVTDARNNSTTAQADIWGRTAAVIPPTGPGLTYTYDELDRLLTATRSASGPPEDPGTNPGTTGLVGWWSMNETSGTRNDSHTTNHLTDVNTVAYAAGKVSNAADLEADSFEFLERTDNAALSTGDIDFTVSAWVNLESKSASTMNIVTKRNSASVLEYVVRWDNSSDRFQIVLYNSSGTAVCVVSANNFGAPSTGTWYFINAWHDATANTCNIQINNGTSNSAAETGTVSDTVANFRIGAIDTTEVGFFDGLIDEVIFYKRALTSAERNWLYNSGTGRAYGEVNPPANPGTSNLISWWSLNETSGTRNDSFGTNHLTDVNTVAYAAGKVSNAADLEANSFEFFERADNASLSTGDIDFSVAYWVNLESKTALQVAVGKYNSATVVEYTSGYDNASDRFFIALYNSSGTLIGSQSANNLGSPSTGTWYYVVAWHDSVNNEVGIQVNNGIPNTSVTTGAPSNTAANFRIGAIQTTEILFFDGLIDEVAFYKKVLAPNQRTWLYNSGAGRSYAEVSAPVNPGTANLISWWELNETSDIRVDSHVNAQSLTDNSTVSYVTGKKGNAADLEESSFESLERTDNAFLSTGDIDFTFATWVKLESLPGHVMMIFTKLESVYVGEYWLYSLYSGKFQFVLGGSGSPVCTVTANAAGAPSVGTWYYVVVWHDAAANTCNIQVNNGAVDTAAETGVVTDTAANFRIGAQNTLEANFFDGAVDELAFYKRVLTVGERTWLYNSGSGRSYDEINPPVDPPDPPEPSTTALTYDNAGRKTAMSDPDMGDWDYTYDALGNLSTQLDARFCTLTLTYDLLGRLDTKSSSGGGCGTQISTDYNYDSGTNGIGRRTSMTDDSGSTTWTYDTRGRVISEAKTISTNTYTTLWTYNSADLPETMTYPDEEEVAYTYDSRMLLDTLIGDDTYVSDTTYDSAGRVLSRALGNGLTPGYTYYAWNAQVSSVGQGGRLQNTLTGTLQDLNYTYDAVGNVTQIDDDIASEVSDYEYDDLDRLTEWTLDTDTEAYTYDSATGNLDSKDGVDYTYDTNHPHAVESLSNGNAYDYDVNGNQITRDIGSDIYNLIYNAENRLIEVKKNSTTIATFAYDGDGKQVKSVVNSTTTYFAGAHYQVVDGVVTKYYFAGASRVALRVGGTLSYALADHLGSTALTTNNSGGLVSELRYKPWGETRYTNGTTPTNYRYTGQREESSFGLYFYNARWYDSSLGRFAQADSVMPGGIQGLDRYAYGNNSPLRYVDPSGHKGDDGCGAYGCPENRVFKKVVEDYFLPLPRPEFAYWSQFYAHDICVFFSPGSMYCDPGFWSIGLDVPDLKIGSNDSGFSWGTLNALGWRIDGTLFGGLDGNVDFVYFGKTDQLGIFVALGGQQGSGGVIAFTTGPLFGFNREDRSSWGGASYNAGAHVPLVLFGNNVEGEIAVSAVNVDGTLPTSVYIGAGPPQPEAGVYHGPSVAFDIIGIYEMVIGLLK